MTGELCWAWMMWNAMSVGFIMSDHIALTGGALTGLFQLQEEKKEDKE